jgi:hypothetical protein
VTEAQALTAALRRHYPGESIAIGPARREGDTVRFGRTGFFHAEPSVTRVAFPAADGSLRAGLLVETWSQRRNQLHHTLVGAGGDVLFVELRTSADSYNVFPESPLTTPQTLVPGPGAGSAQSPAGWLFAGEQNTIDIAGNNVNAYLDASPDNNRPDRGGGIVTTGDFVTAADLTVSPSTTANRDVSVQNLFYLNNVVHDILRARGFTEAAGNFQEDNFGLGGTGGDSVNAEAQDGSGTDNANFATPSDGRNPRMQMFLWTGAGPDHEVFVNAPPSVAGSYGAAGAEFGRALSAEGVTGQVVVVDDGVDTPSDGCEGAQAAVRGAIALIDRGVCAFTVKVLNAQRAGAIAVIVANNAGGTIFAPMGGDDPKIRIPSVMIGQNAGAALKGETGVNATLRKHPNPPLMIDSALDSDVVYHEYGHGLTWRMIGGMSGPLAGAVGEGASDAVTMLISGDDRIGEYSASSPIGIRRNPYAGYPRTYKDVMGEQVHDDGEVYAAIIWRLIELFGANGVPIDTLFGYVVDGMNFTPATPAFEDMRDGILQSAANAGDVHSCLVWQGFAEFGVGEGADGVATSSGVTITESFAVPAACQ